MIYNTISDCARRGKKMLVRLIDPDKFDAATLYEGFDLYFVGGSTADGCSSVVRAIHDTCSTPVVLFPGNPGQFTPEADALLFLTLMNSRNPRFLIDWQLQSADAIVDSGIESIPMGYILVDGSVYYVNASSGILKEASHTLDKDTTLTDQKTGKSLKLVKGTRFFGEDGVMRTGWYPSEEKKSFFYNSAGLRQTGYILVDGHNEITLTEKGMEIAQRIYDRHKALTTFLIQLGVDEAIAKEDACKIEHDISNETYQAILREIGEIPY